MARTERESDNRRKEVADFLVLPRPAKIVQNGAGFSGKTECHSATESDLSATEKEVGKYPGAAFAKNRRNRAVSPEYQIMRGERKSRWARAAP